MILNSVEIPFHFMQHITLNCHKYYSLQKSCYIAQNRVHPRKSQLKREVRSKRNKVLTLHARVVSTNVYLTCTYTLRFTCTVSFHIWSTSPYIRKCVFYTNQCARTIKFPWRRYAFLTT